MEVRRVINASYVVINEPPSPIAPYPAVAPTPTSEKSEQKKKNYRGMEVII